MSAYRTLLSPASAEYTVNKSRFIGYAAPVSTDAEALAFLESIRKKHRDATHNCYAYTLGQNMGVMRYSDDGEPGGTAGLPMMEVIKKKAVCNCCAVVTRYFGGILLGAGGLVRAYSHACSIGLEAAKIVVMEESRPLLCEVAYPLWDRVQHMLKAQPVRLENVEFTSAVTFTLLVRLADQAPLVEALIRLTDGRVEILPEDARYCAWETDEGT